MVRSPASRIVARGAHFQTTSCGPRSVQFACFFMGLTTYAVDVRVTSITTELVHTLSRVMANNAALDNALEEMAQNTAKQELSSLQANVPGSMWPPLAARECFLARQDRLLGTLALTSISWAAFDPKLNDGVRRHFEPGPASAQCGFVRASHCEFGAFFFTGAGGLHSVHGSGSSSLAPSWLRILGPLRSGSRAQDDERKSDDQHEVGRWHGKKSAQRREGICRTSLAWYHLPQNFALVAFTRTSCFPFLVKLLLSRTPFLKGTAGYADQHAGSSAMAGRRGWSRSV